MAQLPSAVTPPPSATSFICSTPTASLRSSDTAKRLSIVSLDPEFDLGKDPLPSELSRDRRIEQWLQQQCGAFIALEPEKDKPALQSTEDGVQPQLRHAQSSRTLLTTCSATTPVTNASFSWESDPLLSSPTTPSSSPAVPFASGPNFSTQLLAKPPLTHAHPETEAARADSPLLGFPGLAVPELPAIPDDAKPLDEAKPADVDKPLPLPPTTSTPAVAESTPLEAPLIAGPAPESARRIYHSPTSSYSSSSSSRQHTLSESNGHSSISQLPIGLANPHGSLRRTPSGTPSNGVSRNSSFTPSLRPGLTLSMATLAPTRRGIHQELREETTTPTLPLSASTRARSHSNAIPTSMKQFHLPTGMIHRSQSHAQLRDGLALSTIFSHDLGSKGVSPIVSLLSVSGGAGVAPRLAKKPSKSVISPPISRTHSSTPSYASVSVTSREEVGDPVRSRPSQISPRHIRQVSHVPSLSSSSSRNAVYIDTEEDISERLGELLLLAKEEMESSVVEEDENENAAEEGEEGVAGGEQWVDMVKVHVRAGSINQIAFPPPNSPATGYFGSTLSVAGSQAASATGASSSCLNGAGFYASPEAGSSQVYLGSNPISQNHSIEQLCGKHLNIAQAQNALLPPLESDTTIGDARPIVDSVQQEVIAPCPATDMQVSLSKNIPTLPEPIDDEETMEEALALARELAVEDRMVWGVRASLEMFDDCWSEFEDEEMGVGVCTVGGVPRVCVERGPYQAHGSVGDPDVTNDQEGHVRFRLGDYDDGGLAPPSVSRWSLTSSIDEEKRASLEVKSKKEKKRRSFVPFIVSGDKDKEPKDSQKESGTIGKKRNRLASFISRLSSVGLGGSGSNTPSSRTPPFPMLSASSSSNALPGLFSAPTVPPKWDSPSLPALTPNFSATPSRSSSPTPLSDLPQLQTQPQVTIVAEDDCSISSPSSSRLVLSSFISTTYDSPPVCRPPTPPQNNPPMTYRRPIPPGIVIPPIPTRPPPELPTLAPPLCKAASEGLINVYSPPPMISRPRSNSAADSLGKHVTFTSSLHIPTLSPRMEQASMTLPSTLRRSVLAKSASASVLGLHQQLKPLSPIVHTDAGGYDDAQIPPTPTSIISTEEYGESRRREDLYDDGHGLQPKRHRLRAMSSFGSLPSNGTLNPGPPRTKGGLKGFVGRLTGRGKNPTKVNPDHISLGTGSHNSWSLIDDSELPTSVAMDSKASSPKHSPSPSFSNGAVGGNYNAAATVGGGVGMLSGFKFYLERTPFRQ